MRPIDGPLPDAWKVRYGEGRLPLNARTIIERNSLFRGLKPSTLEQIAALATRRTYKNGAVVFLRGDPGDSLYGVVTGQGPDQRECSQR